jgi:hypothetical protein
MPDTPSGNSRSNRPDPEDRRRPHASWEGKGPFSAVVLSAGTAADDPYTNSKEFGPYPPIKTMAAASTGFGAELAKSGLLHFHAASQHEIYEKGRSLMGERSGT